MKPGGGEERLYFCFCRNPPPQGRRYLSLFSPGRLLAIILTFLQTNVAFSRVLCMMYGAETRLKAGKRRE